MSNKKKRSVHVPVTKAESAPELDEKTGAEDAGSSAQAPPEQNGAPEDEEHTEQELETLREKSREYDELLDTLQRLKAEYLNYQKRVEREREEWRQACMREAFLKILPVLDNLERAVEAAGQLEGKRQEAGGGENLLRGVELTLKQFRQVLSSEGIEPFQSVGAKFDPRFHEAVLVQDSAGFEPDTILAEMERGYMIGEKVLRPARVIVSRRPPAPQSRQE
jgi:molecular chaperone GrpE